MQPLTLLFVGAALVVTLSTIPFSLTAIEYRQRDNGLAYLLLVVGVGVWNAMAVAQALSPEPLIRMFFLSLSAVGAVLSGLGWFLFATTASRTINRLTRREIYIAIGVLGGLDIVLAVTSPVHALYWQLPAAAASGGISPGPGYWLHTGLLVVLFGTGTGLFAHHLRDQPTDRYARIYTAAGTATVLAVVVESFVRVAGLSVVPIVVATLTTAGWMQASRGDPLAWLRTLRS